MLLKIARDGKHKELEQNKWFFMIPEFSGLTSRQAHFVALFSDFESPVPKGFPDKERRKLALLSAGWGTRSDKAFILDTRGYDLMNGKIEDVEKAITKYRQIQEETNEDYKQLSVLNKRIDHLRVMVTNNSNDYDEQVKLGKLTDELFELYEKKKSFERKIGKPIDEKVLDDDLEETEEGDEKKLSLIERIANEDSR